MGEIITYEVLYDILRKEKYEKELQKLDENLFQEIIKYLEEKEAILESQKNKDSLFSKESEKTQKQVENIKKIIKEIYEKRENKIVQNALIYSRFSEKDLPNMLKEEMQFYNELRGILNKYRKNILESLLLKKLPNLQDIKLTEEKEPFLKKEEHGKEKREHLDKDIEKNDETSDKIKLIRFLHPVPQFIGEDLIIYGPFENEDISSLPIDIANLLIKKNKAEEINPI